MADFLTTMRRFGYAPDWAIPKSFETGARPGTAEFNQQLYERTAAQPAGHRGGPWLEIVGAIGDVEGALAKIAGDRNLSGEGQAKAGARAARDGRIGLNKLAGTVDEAKRAVVEARQMYKPATTEPTVLSTLWAKLDDDNLNLENQYRHAVAAEDWVTCAAIETVPTVFNRLRPDVLATLKRERHRAEDPETATILARAEGVAADMGRVYAAANGILGTIESRFPDPDSDTGQRDADRVPIADTELMK